MGGISMLAKFLAKSVGKGLAKGAGMGARGVPPKYEGYPSFVLKDPSTMDAWQRKELQKLAQGERHGWMNPTVATNDTKREWIGQLSNERHVTPSYVEELVKVASQKSQLRTIVKYLKSAAADNIDRWERAQLIAQCFEKIRAFDILDMLR